MTLGGHGLSSSMREFKSSQEGESLAEDITVSGQQAKFHNPIQNADSQNIEEFIQKLYKDPQHRPKTGMAISSGASKKLQGRMMSGKSNAIPSNKDIVRIGDVNTSGLSGKGDYEEGIHDSDTGSQKFSFGAHRERVGGGIAQVISLPVAMRKHTTSGSYSPYSANFKSLNATTRQQNQVEQENQIKQAESERE